MGRLIVFAVLLLAGCQTTGGSFCDNAKPVYTNQAERNALRPETAKRILTINETWDKLCN